MLRVRIVPLGWVRMAAMDSTAPGRSRAALMMTSPLPWAPLTRAVVVLVAVIASPVQSAHVSLLLGETRR